MTTFSRAVREYIYFRAGHMCECRKKGCLLNNELAIHHIYPNTKPNRRIFKKKLQSSHNAVLLCSFCHQEYYYLYREFRENLLYIE